jgi:pyruvate dehydrogenase E2 component (dihydrolipoamide acetyltransferase)
MAYEVVMPRLGWNMEEGSLAEWLKRPGDQIEAGEVLFSVESDKAVQEVEALEGGVLYIPPGSPAPGQTVPVGTLLAYLLAPGEPTPGEAGPAPQSASVGQGSGAAHKALGSTARPASAGAPPGPDRPRHHSSPRARRIAAESGVDWSGLRGSGRTGRIVERDIRQAASAAARAPAVSPLARLVAAELGVDVDRLAADMAGKRIERADVEAAAGQPQLASPPAAAEGTALGRPRDAGALPPGVTLPLSTVRRTIAERMATSAHTTAPVTLTTEADATALVRLRRELKDGGVSPLPSYNDLLAKLAARALTEHPAVNARLEDDRIVQAATVNVGIAVDTERGLLVPVLRDVQTKSLGQVARESAALIERVRSGGAGPDDLRGGTFTITNLGMYEIDAFTPIINLPECAILGVGRIVPKQVVVDVETERLAVRHMVFVSLTFDHRLVDGAPAARFLQRIKQYVERPYLWLVD